MNAEECKWLEFFDDPSQWWDNRAKNWTNYPHFKHVRTGKGLWMNSPDCPKWVEHKLKSLKEAGCSQNARAERKESIEEELATSSSINQNHQKPATIASVLAALKHCSRSKDIQTGRKIHSQLLSDSRSLVSNMYLVTSLINMYSKCGCMEDAQKVFDASSLHHDVVCWTALVTGYVNNRECERAFQLFQAMEDRSGCIPNARTVVAALSSCATLASKKIKTDPEECSRWLETGRGVFTRALRNKSCDIFVENTMVDMFARCGRMLEARRAFDGMVRRDIVSWNVLLQGYVESGEGELALELFDELEEGLSPDSRTYVAALSACAALGTKQKKDGNLRRKWLGKGREIHAEALRRGCGGVFVESTSVEMYSKCGSMVDARSVFDNMSQKNVVVWSSLIMGYVDNGEAEAALKIFDDGLEGKRCVPNGRTFVAALLACAALGKEDEERRLRWLEKGRLLHSLVISKQCADVFVENSLVEMYSQCGSMVEARGVFDAMVMRDQVSWNVLLQGYVENGESELALELFDGFMRGRCVPDDRSYVAALSACAALAAKSRDEMQEKNSKWIETGARIHSEAANNGCCGVFVESTLVDMYAKCGDMVEARKVFDNMNKRDVVSWTALLQGYVENGENELALELFDRMEKDGGCVPNARTYIVALSACGSLAAKEDRKVAGKFSQWLDKGKAIHSEATQKRCCDSFVNNALIDMYGRCGSMVDARKVFDAMKKKQRDVVSWNALLQGYVENGESELALEIFEGMQEDGCVPGARTYVAALTACSTLAARQKGRAERSRFYAQKGREIHSKAIFNRCCDIYVESTLIDLYGKCGEMELARNVFERMIQRNVVTWTALIMGYVENDRNEVALEMIKRMDESGVARNGLTYVAALMACGNLMAAESGKAFHEELRGGGFEKDVVVANCLIDFYGKCGEMEAAKQVFDSIARKTVVSWTCLMCGYGLRGEADRVFELFQMMKEQGVPPNDVTFVCVLSACSHAGLIDKGKEFFNTMLPLHGVSPSVKHYACMVDLLGRANYLDEALKIMKNMPFEPDAVMWTAILGASQKWRNAAVGKLAYDSLVRIDEKDGVAYVLMASIYNGFGNVISSSRAAESSPGQTRWTDELGNVHKFVII